MWMWLQVSGAKLATIGTKVSCSLLYHAAKLGAVLTAELRRVLLKAGPSRWTLM